MFSLHQQPTRLCDGLSRRELIRVGGLSLLGLSLPGLVQARQAAEDSRAGASFGKAKNVIFLWLQGGPPQHETFDPKPDAPAEIRGEFQPIATNVPGIQICEHTPRQAQIMDKLAIVRGIRSNDLGDHTPHYIITGFPDRGKRPAFGSVVSYLHPQSDGFPPYVSLMYKPPGLYDNESPAYTGSAHRPFVPKAEGLANLSLTIGISRDRLGDRRALLSAFDTLRREADYNG